MSAFASPLTVKQANVLRFLDVFIAEEGRSPSLREIAEAFGENTTCMATLRLRALERLGYIARGPAEKGQTPRGRRVRREITILRRAPLLLVVRLRDAAARCA